MSNMKNGKHQVPKEIRSINVPLATPTTPSAKEHPGKITVTLGTTKLPSSVVQEYNYAAAQEKAWKKIKEEGKPKLESKALSHLYDHNTSNPTCPVKTVCLVDTTGAACNVSLKDTYANTQHDPDRVTNGLHALGQLDPNKFVAEKVIIGFNTAVFYDENGALRRELYIAMMEAIQGVADEHGVDSPFSSSKVVTVKPGFAESRWSEFTVEQQPRVSELFPASVSLTPLAPEKVAKV